MSSTKIDHPELTRPLLWVMAIATGLIVANLYYNQPLLVIMARTFHVNDARIRQVAALTQLGYAAGMLFIAPLADMVRRKKLILLCLAICVVALIGAAASPDINILIIASFLMGVFSLIPQLLVPMTAHLAKPAERGRNERAADRNIAFADTERLCRCKFWLACYVLHRGRHDGRDLAAIVPDASRSRARIFRNLQVANEIAGYFN